MDKFYHLSGGPFLLMNVHTLLIKNLEEIKKLIINKKFIPFPPTRRLYFYSGYHVDYNLEKFPPFDGYEQHRNLNIIARAIMFKPELINTWKSIGYSEVCDDFNEAVIHGLFLSLDPPSQVQHAFEKLVLNLEKFIEMGFRLTDRIIVDVLQFYEHELAELGEFLWRVFRSIRTGESDFTFIFGLFKVAFDPNRCHEKDDIFIFLKSKTTHHENFLRQILGQHFNRENLDDINFNIRKKSLIFSPIIYEFVIKNYGSDSDLSLMCFKDTLALRIYYDDPNNGKFANKISIRLIKDIYDYFKIRIDYLPEHMELLRRAKSADIVKPFLEDFVPNVFLSNDDIKKSIWFNAIHSLKRDDYFNNYLLRLIEYFKFNG